MVVNGSGGGSWQSVTHTQTHTPMEAVMHATKAHSLTVKYSATSSLSSWESLAGILRDLKNGVYACIIHTHIFVHICVYVFIHVCNATSPLRKLGGKRLAGTSQFLFLKVVFFLHARVFILTYKHTYIRTQTSTVKYQILYLGDHAYTHTYTHKHIDTYIHT
jgi:hypothetical protein